MVTTTRKYTVDDLWQMPPDAPFELWRGELVEMPPSGQESSAVAMWMGREVGNHVEAYDLGIVTGADGGFLLLSHQGVDTVVAPDVGFVHWQKIGGRTLNTAHCPVPPDLAIEVTSPFDRPGRIAEKLRLYVEAGVPLVWWVDLQKRVVRVYRSGKPEQTLRAGDFLDGEDVLPGFRLAVANIFAV
ncbi:MAG TPA: Uma2 family endonuclease [Thermomicrobiales bacterium]|nr:Uma2 family endonuclease [Thermomicrobiales bacterium]